MVRVLIVDDELLVQLGLKSMINWEEHGLVIAAEARNGQEALAAFERTDPGIVFVDIAMPEMNGLELIRLMKKRKPSVKTIILTSHTDFNYVKEAASLNVSEYLLKSEITRDNLAQCIHNILNQIGAEASGENKNRASSPSNAERLVKDDLFKLITGFYTSQGEMDFIIDKYKFSFKGIWFVSVAQFLIKDNVTERYRKDPEHFNTVILDLSNQAFSEKDLAVYSTIVGEKIIILFHVDISMNIPAVKEKIMSLLYLFKSNLTQFLNMDLCAGISGHAESLTELPELYRQAYNANELAFFEKDKIIAYTGEEQPDNKADLPKINYKAIERILLKGDEEELEKNLEDIFRQLYICKSKEYVRTVSIDLLSQAKVFIQPLSNGRNTPALSEASFNYNIFQKLYKLEDIKKYIADIYKKAIRMGKNQGQDQHSYSIQKSMEYIKKNYGRNITLSDAAKYSEVSKNYLSFLFKQEIGTNFSAFLLNFRIEKSKELLTSGNLKIYEIADMVGFGNPYYFSKVFRETVGISCREYQKLYYEGK